MSTTKYGVELTQSQWQSVIIMMSHFYGAHKEAEKIAKNIATQVNNQSFNGRINPCTGG